MNPNFQALNKFNGHQGPVYSIYTQGNLLYSVSSDYSLKIWDILNQKIKKSFKLNALAYSIYVDQNNNILLGLNNGNIQVIKNDHSIKTIRTNEPIAFFSFSESQNENEIFVGSSNGKLFILNSKDYTIKSHINLNCGKIRKQFIRRDLLYLACQNGFIYKINTSTKEIINFINQHENGVNSICLEANNENILYSGGKDALLKAFDISLNQTIKVIPAHNYAIYDIIQLNESIIVSCSRDKTIKVWDKKTMTIISRLDFKSQGHNHSVNNIIKYKNDMFFSCSDDGTIILWKC